MSKRRWMWSAAASIVLAVAGVTAWGAIVSHESPYDRCYRVIHEEIGRVQLSAAKQGVQGVRVDREAGDLAARATCNYLESQGRLNEASAEDAGSLMSEAGIAGGETLLKRTRD